MQTLPIIFQSTLAVNDFDPILTDTAVNYQRALTTNGADVKITFLPVSATRIVVSIQKNDGYEERRTVREYDTSWIEARTADELEMMVNTIVLFA